MHDGHKMETYDPICPKMMDLSLHVPFVFIFDIVIHISSCFHMFPSQQSAPGKYDVLVCAGHFVKICSDELFFGSISLKETADWFLDEPFPIVMAEPACFEQLPVYVDLLIGPSSALTGHRGGRKISIQFHQNLFPTCTP